MNYINLSIFLVHLIGAQAFLVPNLAQSKFDSTLANYLVKSNSMDNAVDPSNSVECFNLYLPILTEIAQTFSTQYQACNTVANQKITNLTAQAEANKANFVQETDDICTAYQNCANETDVLSFFNCYSRVSNQEVSVVYSISSEANTAANTFSVALKEVQNDQAICTNATETTYVDNTATTYKLLDSCLQTGPPAVVSTTILTTENTPTTPALTTENSDNNAETTAAGNNAETTAAGNNAETTAAGNNAETTAAGNNAETTAA